MVFNETGPFVHFKQDLDGLDSGEVGFPHFCDSDVCSGLAVLSNFETIVLLRTDGKSSSAYCTIKGSAVVF